jgi:predicted ATPase/DNA-binding NarL/FixJ family response regulator
MASRTAGGPGNLPIEMTSFVGRGDEVRVARDRLTQSRLVTLTGIGGVGKTRLALQVARASARAFPDGVWLVELDQVPDEALLPQTIADALGLPDAVGPSSAATLVDHLAEQEMLLVLDNCEHHLEAVAQLVMALLRGCPRLRMLATSRQLLTLGGEVALAVPSLSMPDPHQVVPLEKLTSYEAVALFVDRARMAMATFELTEANAASVAEICSRLDGLPLAIELAAARLRVLTPAQINARLQNRFALLTRGPRERANRQQTLRACVDWSYHLCSPAEQRLWARLSVFAGGFELDAVESICAGDDLAEEDVPDLLGTLLDKSILARDHASPGVRFRMLETLCHYGAERLTESGEKSKLRRRHRDWYEHLVVSARTDWIGPRQGQWLERLDRERPDIRASLKFSLLEPGESVSALRIGAALHMYWIIRGLTSEARHWLGHALEQPSEPSRERLAAVFTATDLAAAHGDLATATTLAQHAEEMAALLGDPHSHAIAGLATAAAALHSPEPAQAAAVLQPALEVFESEGDDYWTAVTLAWLARVKGFLGETRAAAMYYTSLRSHSPSCTWLQSEALGALGLSLWKDGDTNQALVRLKSSLQLKRGMTDTFGTALCLDALAWIAADSGHFRRAAILLGAVAALQQPSDSRPSTYLFAHTEHCARQVSTALGETGFRAAVDRGKDLGLAEAITYALDDHLDEPLPTGRAATAGAPAATTRSILTPRQWEICELIAEGLDTKELATKLVLSQRTIEGHVQNILNKLNLDNRAGIVTWTLRQR